jgi:hypothetical protein
LDFDLKEFLTLNSFFDVKANGIELNFKALANIAIKVLMLSKLYLTNLNKGFIISILDTY